MYSYITSELPQTVFSAFEQVDGSRVSIFGHSMGGHGALTIVRFVFIILPATFLSLALQRFGHGIHPSQKIG